MIPQLERTAQVWAITGNLGGGKTLTAVSMAYQAMRKGYYVVSNVKLNIDKISLTVKNARQLYRHIDVQTEEIDEKGDIIVREQFNPFDLPAGSPRGTRNPKRVLVILDEVAEWFDQYSNAKSPLLARVMSWLRHSSKRNQDVIFIVQRKEYLQKNFRLLVSRWIICDDLAVWRIPVAKIRIPFVSDWCMARIFDRAGQLINRLYFIDKYKYGQYYNTAENLSSWGKDTPEYEVLEEKVDPLRNFPLLFLLWLASLFLPLFI